MLCLCAHAAPARTSISYALLQGFALPNPTNNGLGLIPQGLISPPAAAATATAGDVSGTNIAVQTNAKISPYLRLTDVRLLVDSTTLQQHLDFFKATPGAKIYTVRAAPLRHSKGLQHANAIASSCTP